MSQEKAAHENPLIPNARLKQMYRAILRAHLLGHALPPAQRALTAAREAALVSTSIDLTARDLVLDAFSNPVVDFLRGAPLHRALAPRTNGRVPHPSSAWVGSHHNRSSFWTAHHAVQNLRIPSSTNAPRSLPAPPDPSLRIQSALGAATALKAAAAQTSKNGKRKSESTAHDSAVVLATALPGEVPAESWKPALAFAAQHDLPVIFVILPSISTHKRAPKLDLRAIAHRARVPAMPVDAADPVALYRVAQESIGHARIGGGPALIECIAFSAAPRNSATSPSLAANLALAHFEQYMLQRGVATRAWMDHESASFTAQIRSLKSASN